MVSIQPADSGIDSGSSPELPQVSSRSRVTSSNASTSNSNALMMLSNDNTSMPQPMSRTHQYRKVMKPLLERKRRARINRCLDELKDLMVSALQTEGESITKLEKADVLEMTVKHLRKLKKENQLGLTPQATYAGKFKAGYAHCAQEVSHFMTSQRPCMDPQVSTRLISHLCSCIQTMDGSCSSNTHVPPPQLSPPEEGAALDLRCTKSKGSPSDYSRQRQYSNDSSDLSDHSSQNEKSSWRPW